MKLTKDLKIKIYEVLADYKVKVTSSPFIAILKFAEENGGEVDSKQLYKDFLYPISEKACKNILERLANMGYFERDNSNIEESYEDDYYRDFDRGRNTIYSLTELGYQSAKQKEFYENRNGILKIYLTDNEFVEQKLVKIEEINRQDSFEEKYIKNIEQTELKRLKNSNQHIILENGTFILVNFKEKCRTFKDESKQLTLQANQTNSEIKLMDFRDTLNKNYFEVRNEILRNEFERDYLEKEQVLKIDFNPNDLELQRNLKVQEPIIGETSFNSVKLESVKLSPKNSLEAKKWFKALVAQNINKYFLSETEFTEFVNKISQEFELFSKELKNSISKEETIQELNKEKDFYKKAKLETIDYLNY